MTVPGGPEYNSIMTISLAEMWTHDTNTNNIIYFLSLINSIIHQTNLQPENLKIMFRPEGREEGGEERRGEVQVQTLGTS